MDVEMIDAIPPFSRMTLFLLSGEKKCAFGEGLLETSPRREQHLLCLCLPLRAVSLSSKPMDAQSCALSPNKLR